MLLKRKDGRYEVISLSHALNEHKQTYKLGLLDRLSKKTQKGAMEDIDLFIQLLQNLTALEARYIQKENSLQALYLNGLRLSIVKMAISDFKLNELSPLLLEIQRDYQMCRLTNIKPKAKKKKEEK